MKRLRYIFIVILPLPIVYVRAGAPIVQCCCSGCKTANCCYADKYGFCNKFDFESHKSCRGEGCTATIHKLNLVKQAFESFVPAPISVFLYSQVSELLCVLFRDGVLEIPYVAPPPKTGSRHYLILYSTLPIQFLQYFTVWVVSRVAQAFTTQGLIPLIAEAG